MTGAKPKSAARRADETPRHAPQACRTYRRPGHRAAGRRLPARQEEPPPRTKQPAAEPARATTEGRSRRSRPRRGSAQPKSTLPFRKLESRRRCCGAAAPSAPGRRAKTDKTAVPARRPIRMAPSCRRAAVRRQHADRISVRGADAGSRFPPRRYAVAGVRHATKIDICRALGRRQCTACARQLFERRRRRGDRSPQAGAAADDQHRRRRADLDRHHCRHGDRIDRSR